MMEIIEVNEVSDQLVSAFNQLIPQLDPSCEAPSRTNLEEIIASPVCHLFAALDGNQSSRMVGTLTLVVYRIPAGVKAWIEDLVVDEYARGQGVATSLIDAALNRAAELGSHEVNLTSGPWREAATHLYQHLDFVISGTNVYKKTINNSSTSVANFKV